MILGVTAITDVVLYFVYSAIPMFASFMPIIMPIFYAMVFGGGIVGIVLSIIGISKNRSKFGIIGIITSLIGVVVFLLIIFLLQA